MSQYCTLGQSIQPSKRDGLLSFRSLGVEKHQNKPRKVGRPKLPKGHAKAKIVPVRYSGEELKRILSAKGKSQDLSKWIRKVTLKAAG